MWNNIEGNSMAIYNFKDGKKRIEEILKNNEEIEKNKFQKMIVNLHIIME